MNPFDEIAVEEAVRLKEKHKDDVTRIVSARKVPLPAPGLIVSSAGAQGAEADLLLSRDALTPSRPLRRRSSLPVRRRLPMFCAPLWPWAPTTPFTSRFRTRPSLGPSSPWVSPRSCPRSSRRRARRRRLDWSLWASRPSMTTPPRPARCLRDCSTGPRQRTPASSSSPAARWRRAPRRK
uniref:Putative electron transfer flavoprotein beta subunit n=1 Tax=Pseudozyma flocculosa TaxID=84751 RepID=D2X5X7_9BASI|nr:putative electron transfer flavoprotein beta subunit [Pseudozyma flocculosa]